MKWLKLFAATLIFVGSSLALLLVVAAATILLLPDVRKLETCFTTSMYQVKLCRESPHYVRLRDISPYMIHALIAAEDGSFYSHNGFDWHEMEESLNADLRDGRIRRGGSTLTQQLAKNVFLDKEKSLWRKLKEAYLAYAIEKHYTKDFILEKYLNVVEFGPDIYGIQVAADHYFHKPAGALNPLESAYLAILLPNPKSYSKSFRSGQLTPYTKKMVTTVLKRMSSFGKLSPAAYQTALQELPHFPWTGLSGAVFSGNPGYEIESHVNSVSEKEALDRLYNDDESDSRAEESAVGTAGKEKTQNTDPDHLED